MDQPKKPHNLKLFKSLSVARVPQDQVKDGPSANLVLAALRSFCISGKVACNPSIQEIAEMLGVSEKTVDRALKTLVATGRIEIQWQHDDFPSTINGREVYKKHNVYVMLKNPADFERFGLFPVALFGAEAFVNLSITAQSILLSLYLTAEGQHTVFFLMHELMEEAMVKKREFALKALRELQDGRFIQGFKNPCNKYMPYETTHLRADLLLPDLSGE